MSHEPTEEEWAAAWWLPKEAITAANAIRDRRIRAEALEEAAALFDGDTSNASAWIARCIRALKDKTDE